MAETCGASLPAGWALQDAAEIGRYLEALRPWAAGAKDDIIPKKAAFAADMVNAVVDGFSDLKLAVHLCRRAGEMELL